MKFRAALLLILIAQSLLAQFPGSPAVEEDLVSLRYEIRSNPPSGGRVEGAAILEIKEGWHINSNVPKSDYLIPTALTLTSSALSNVEVQFPPHVERTFGFSDEALAVYEGTVTIPFTATRTAASEDRIEVKLGYQACNDQVCLPPREVSVSGTLSSTGGSASAATSSQEFTPLASAPAQKAKKVSLLSGNIGAIFEEHGIAVALLVTFILGVLLNLTPCVYPLIPITLAYFASQSEGSRSRRRLLAFVYVLGLVLTYASLGVFAALSGALFGAWLQHPFVLIFFGLLMVVLAFSMFGFYEFKVPHFIADRAGARSGFAGALAMGLLSGIVAAPCVGPVLVSLIAFVGQSKSIALGATLFFVLALGLGLPYLIGLSALPRSGAWMVQIKKALGFVLLAMLFYFIRPLTGETVFRIGFGSMLLIGAIFLFLRKEPNRAAAVIRFIAAILFVAGAIFFLTPRADVAGIAWEKYSDAALTGAKIAGRPVVIDFYADWCIPCKQLDARTFSNEAVVRESERFVRLKADLTTADDSTAALAKRYAIVGVPTIVFIDSSGKEIDEARLTGFEDADAFLGRIRAVD
jgi:thioredoxin:protein disulfide reductase